VGGGGGRLSFLVGCGRWVDFFYACASRLAVALCSQRKGTAATSAGGGTGVDRGKSTSGLGGEQLKLDVDPSCHTAVQRSWLYGGDAGLAAAVKPPAPRDPPSYMSLPLGGSGIPSGVTIRGDGLFAAPVRVILCHALQSGLFGCPPPLHPVSSSMLCIGLRAWGCLQGRKTIVTAGQKDVPPKGRGIVVFRDD
jgi:hypothetical protein